MKSISARLQRKAARLSVAFVCAFASAQTARAVQTLVTVEDGTVVHSGPGRRFRPIAKLEAKTELKAADQEIEGRDGRRYWRVIAPVDGQTKAIGYVWTEAGLRKKPAGATVDDLANYSEIALARKTVSSSFGLLSGNRKIATAGLTYYMSPGFYARAWVGGFFDPNGAASAFAGEIGNDALLIGRVSGFVSFSTGLFTPTKDDRIFEGSSRLNGIAMASVGARWNASEWSAGLGWAQVAAFNANNSLVTFGPLFVVEAAL